VLRAHHVRGRNQVAASTGLRTGARMLGEAAVVADTQPERPSVDDDQRPVLSGAEDLCLVAGQMLLVVRVDRTAVACDDDDGDRASPDRSACSR
jgi:hypothetical protein